MNHAYLDMPPRWAIRYVDTLIRDKMVLCRDANTIPLRDTEPTEVHAWTLQNDARCYAGVEHVADGVTTKEQDALIAWLQPFGIVCDIGDGSIDSLTGGYERAVFTIPPLNELASTVNLMAWPDPTDDEEGEPPLLIG